MATVKPAIPTIFRALLFEMVAVASVAATPAIAQDRDMAIPTERLVAQADANDKPKGKSSRAEALLDDNATDEAPSTKLSGFYQFEGAYALPSPAHGSKLRNRLEVVAQGTFSDSVKWRLGGRVNYDAIFDVSNFYPSQVRDDQRFEAMFRETYLDISAGNVEFRVGRQHIVWGEVVGLFFADVVSAKDLREFVLPDFDLLRIPQWAARAEYFKNDFHLEAIWIPVPTVDNIGKPGAEFYAYPPAAPDGFNYIIENERKPSRNGANLNYGLRSSLLKNGWDIAGFAYRSVDASPTYFRQVVAVPAPAFIYTPRHTKITQYGVTLAKDLGDMVL